MKIRIRGNTIRFRLTRSEVETVATSGYLSEKTEFNTGSFSYAIKVEESINNFNADFKSDTITLYLPAAFATEWVTTERVGFEDNIKLNNGSNLFVLIEKDFVCMDESIEDQSDNYPNPAANKGNE